jgi:hypothetical protein
VSVPKRSLAIAIGFALLAHLGFLALLVFSIRTPPARLFEWRPAFRITLIRRTPQPKPVRAKHRRARPSEPAASALHGEVATGLGSHAPPVLVAPRPASASPQAGPAEDAGAGLAKVLHGLAACHDRVVVASEHERQACQDRLGRLADAAAPIRKRPPPAAEDPPQKAGECRLDKHTLISPHMKCKFW